MSSDTITLSADLGDIGSLGRIDIPVQGPGGANLLVMLNGITLSGVDVDWNAEVPLSFLIETDFKLGNGDVLRASTGYVCLASIGADDNKPMEVALDQVTVIQRTSDVIALLLQGAILGDTTIFRIAYQANLLIKRQH